MTQENKNPRVYVVCPDTYNNIENAYRFINAKESEGHGVYVFRYMSNTES